MREGREQDDCDCYDEDGDIDDVGDDEHKKDDDDSDGDGNRVDWNCFFLMPFTNNQSTCLLIRNSLDMNFTNDTFVKFKVNMIMASFR